MNATKIRVREFDGPERLLRVDGHVQITLKYRPESRWLTAGWTASALGWSRGTCLVAECPDKATLIEYCADRFPGCEINEA